LAIDFPSNPILGQSFTSDGAVYTWNGYAWTGGLPISLATPGVSGLMPGADKTKLDGIQPGATANLANSALLARANHTGTQLAATISDFNAAVAAAGGGGGGGGMTDAQLLARANHTGTQVAATISDLTSAVNAIVGSGGGGMSDAALLARANHTGTQLAATISDFAAAVAALGGAGMTEAAITKLYGLLTPFMSTTIAGGNGATNDSPSIQEKINAVVAKGRGTVFLPPGRFRIDNRLSVANSSLRLQGAGVEQTFLEVPASNTVGAIAFTANDKPGGSPYLFEVCDLSIVAVGNGPHGTAIDARWASPNQLNPGLTNLKINNVNVRSETYVAGPGWPTWTNGVYVQNAAWTNIDNLTVFAVDSSGTIGVNLDYPMNSSAFGIMINKLNHNGGGAGVRSRGWMETLYLTNSLIVGSTIGVDLDARSTPYGNMQFAMNNTHINAKNMNVYAYNWRALAFNNNSIYSGLGHGIDQEGAVRAARFLQAHLPS